MRKKIYISFVLIIMLIPFVCMSIVPTNSTTENRIVAQMPSLVEDGILNYKYLSDLGEYFNDHFAFRNKMVGMNSWINATIFRTSTQEKVIYGKNGWLYFNGTLDDYQGTNLLSNRSLYNIAHNLALMQGLIQAYGKQFCYVVAPNKNTLYGENMPINYKKGEESNYNNLLPYLEKENVHYIDLEEIFKSQDEVLYLKGDSHWNNKGALLAYNRILDSMNVIHDDLTKTNVQKRKDYIGDLSSMMFSDLAPKEDQYYYDLENTYKIVSKEDSAEADEIESYNEKGNGNIVMFRDSFGNSLFPFMANHFKNTYYSKLSPYSVGYALSKNPDYVVVERVERRIRSIIEEVPVMQGPMINLLDFSTQETNSTINLQKDGDFIVINGIIDSSVLNDDSKIYVSVHSKEEKPKIAYEMFGCLEGNNDNGYKGYILEKNIPNKYQIDVFVYQDEQMIRVKKGEGYEKSY